MRDPELWHRIRASLLSHPAVFGPVSVGTESPLAMRLHEDADWDLDFARGAVGEYARFIYLARVSPGRVTPSDLIDTVWHIHVTDSRAYVEEFCRKLFGEIVHHVPSAGPGDRPRHAAQYRATLALYREEFASDPPPDYWYRYTPEDDARDRRQARRAQLSGVATGIGMAAILHMAFGWTLFAIFLGIVINWMLQAVLAPRVPGPRLNRSSSGDGCGSGCGD